MMGGMGCGGMMWHGRMMGGMMGGMRRHMMMGVA